MTAADSPRSRWTGKVLLWEDHGLFVGTAGDAELHESPAIKICIAYDDAFRLRTDVSAEWDEYGSAMIPAGEPHAINGNGARMAMLLIAPEGELGQSLSSKLSESGIADIGRFEDMPAFDDDADESSINGEIRRIVSELSDTNERTSGIDPRVAQSIEWIRAGREHGILVKELAAEAELSESRFSHLFTENVRIPVRRYFLWLRLRDVLHMLSSAQNLTEVAHSAGFSDSAHLSRTFRSALGIAPTDLMRGSSITSFLK